MRRAALLLALAALLGACDTNARAPEHAGASSAAPTGALTVTPLKYALIARYDPFFCDPDDYPVGRSEDAVRKDAVAWYDAADKESEEVKAILDHLGYGDRASRLSDDEKLRVYDDHKRLARMELTPSGESFAFTLGTGETPAGSEQVTGTIDRSGAIEETGRTKARYSCPICLPGSALIATPRGPVPVRDLRPGDIVDTLDASGRRIERPLARTVRRPAAPRHVLLRLTLLDGRAIVASPRHPAAGGRPLGSLEPGDPLDGSSVATATLVESNEDATFDILPAGPTGDYWANGILLGSTLSPAFTAR